MYYKLGSVAFIKKKITFSKTNEKKYSFMQGCIICYINNIFLFYISLFLTYRNECNLKEQLFYILNTQKIHDILL